MWDGKIVTDGDVLDRRAVHSAYLVAKRLVDTPGSGAFACDKAVPRLGPDRNHLDFGFFGIELADFVEESCEVAVAAVLHRVAVVTVHRYVRAHALWRRNAGL